MFCLYLYIKYNFMKTTCGIFLFNREGKILVGHPTNSPDYIWSVPKGLKDPGEDDFTAAIRELHEETNISVKDIGEFSVKYLGEFKYSNKKKKISAFSIVTDYDFSEYDIKCESMVTHTSGDDFPEIDAFKWVTIEEALPILNVSQILAIRRLEELKNNVV